MNNDTFAVRLLRAMSREGMNQATLAKASTINHGTISQWIEGRMTPNMLTLVKAAKALRVSTDFLCGLKEEME